MKSAPSRSRLDIFLNYILFVKSEIRLEKFIFETFIYILFVIWGFSFFDDTDFIKNPYGATNSFLHKAIFPFHEFGHLIFKPFGRFMEAAGGWIMQCILPIFCMTYFLRLRDNFAASIGLWWLGQNFMDIAPYVYDAWDVKLSSMITGGSVDPEYHDWHYLLRESGYLNYYAEISSFFVKLGKYFLFFSFLWGGTVIYKKFLVLRGYKMNYTDRV